MSSNTIKFIADGIKIRTGKADGSAEVVFTVGEYAIKDIKQLLDISANTVIKVTVEPE